MPDITSIDPLNDHLQGKKKTLAAAIGKGIMAGIPAMAPVQGIMAPVARPATNQSFSPDVKLGPARAGGLPALTNQGITSTVATQPARGIEQPGPAPGSPPPAPVAQAAPQSSAPVGQRLTAPSAASMPVQPKTAIAEPAKMLFNASQGIDGTGIMQPATTVTNGNMAAGLANKDSKGVTANGTGGNNLGDTASIVQGIMAGGSTTDAAHGITGPGQSPLLEMRGALDPAAAQAIHNRVDFSAGSVNDPAADAKYADEVQKAMRVNAANGIEPTSEQIKTVGASSADVVNLLSANNQNGQFSKGIEAMQTQQTVDVAAAKVKTEAETARQLSIANFDEKAATALWHRAQAGALNSKGAGITGHVIKDADSPTGWSYADQSGNIAAQGAPDPGKKGGMGNMGEPLTPESIQRYAETYNLTGEMPPVGRDTASRLAITNKASELASAQGLSPGDVAAQHEGFKSDKKSLASITKGMDTVMSFEKGVQNSLTLVDKLSDGFNRGKYPGVNKFSQLISQHAGNPEIKAFRNALTTAMTEYMKVTTAGTGISSSELSIGAQARAKELLETSDNVETVKNSIALMRQEMAIKKASFQDQHGEIQIRLAGGSAAPMNTRERFMQDQGVNGIEKARNMGIEAPMVQSSASPTSGARQAPDGKWYVSDPQRPGKYLEVRA